MSRRPHVRSDPIENEPDPGIHLDIDEGTAYITLERTVQRNTLDSRAFGALAATLERIDTDPTIHAAILRSAVPGVFCAGGDYIDPDLPTRPSPRYHPNLAACYDQWSSRGFPVVSIVDGSARAFGAALALTSDITIATRQASFGLPELSGGVIPSVAIAMLRARHSSRVVRELVLTTEPIDAADAARRGLINAVQPDARAAARRVRTLLDTWSRIDPAAIRATMHTLAQIDAARDHHAVRTVAVDGITTQLRRFRNGNSDQRYLHEP